jgi:predicted PurR-regulated permease PerM
VFVYIYYFKKKMRSRRTICTTHIYIYIYQAGLIVQCRLVVVGTWTYGFGNCWIPTWRNLKSHQLKNTNHTQNMGAKQWPNPQSVSSQRIRVDIQTILNRIFLSYMVPTPQKKTTKEKKKLVRLLIHLSIMLLFFFFFFSAYTCTYI